MNAPEIQVLIKDRRAGPALRFLQSPEAQTLSSDDRSALEAIALPLLSEDEIQKKWVSWLSSSAVPFSLLVQQLAKRFVALSEDRKTAFADTLHQLLQQALNRGEVRPGKNEPPDGHTALQKLLAPYLPALPSPPPAIVPPKKTQTQKREPVQVTKEEETFKAVPPPVNLPLAESQSVVQDTAPAPPVRRSLKPQLTSLPNHAPLRPATNVKSVTDVRSPKTFGPLDELRALSLDDFRRMGDTPAQRITQVMTLIDTIARDGIKARREAVRAWLDAPVMQLHRVMGFSMLGSEQVFESEIARRERAGEPTLFKEEFEALTDMIDQLAL